MVDHLRNADYALAKSVDSLVRHRNSSRMADRQLSAGLRHLQDAARSRDPGLSDADVAAVHTAAIQVTATLEMLRNSARARTESGARGAILGVEALTTSVNSVNDARHDAMVAVAHLTGTEVPAEPGPFVPGPMPADATRIAAYDEGTQSLSDYFREVAPQVANSPYLAKSNLVELCAALDRVPDNPAIAPLLDSTRAIAYRTLLGMTGGLPGLTNGYQGFPEVANLGRLRSNLELIAESLDTA
jgi:hypothetical protein